ncbi:MAG TPA: universal stress protein [Mucilaginibacter sp.]|nr:universal stress protein [Mucilaginibacter sp.]
MKYKRILIVVDDSEPSAKAAVAGYGLAAELDAMVALVCVADEALAAGNVDAGIFPEEAELDLKKHTEKLLLKIEHEHSGGIPTEIFAPEGEIKETVLKIAREWKAQVIVAGTHGRKGLSRLFMGSVAEGILRDSPIPVLVVPLNAPQDK